MDFPRRELPKREGPTGAVGIAKPKKRNRDWEKQNKTTSFRIPVEIRDRINAYAREYQVKRDDIARLILEYGLDALDKGELKPKPKFVGKLTLFPD